MCLILLTEKQTTDAIVEKKIQLLFSISPPTLKVSESPDVIYKSDLSERLTFII